MEKDVGNLENRTVADGELVEAQHVHHPHLRQHHLHGCKGRGQGARGRGVSAQGAAALEAAAASAGEPVHQLPALPAALHGTPAPRHPPGRGLGAGWRRRPPAGLRWNRPGWPAALASCSRWRAGTQHRPGSRQRRSRRRRIWGGDIACRGVGRWGGVGRGQSRCCHADSHTAPPTSGAHLLVVHATGVAPLDAVLAAAPQVGHYSSQSMGQQGVLATAAAGRGAAALGTALTTPHPSQMPHTHPAPYLHTRRCRQASSRRETPRTQAPGKC